MESTRGRVLGDRLRSPADVLEAPPAGLLARPRAEVGSVPGPCPGMTDDEHGGLPKRLARNDPIRISAPEDRRIGARGRGLRGASPEVRCLPLAAPRLRTIQRHERRPRRLGFQSPSPECLDWVLSYPDRAEARAVPLAGSGRPSGKIFYFIAPERRAGGTGLAKAGRQGAGVMCATMMSEPGERRRAS